MKEKKNEWVVITEKANIETKKIIKECIINGFPKAWAKVEITKLIDKIEKELKDTEAPEDLIDKTIRAIKYRFVGWFNTATDIILKDGLAKQNSWLLKTYQSITGKELVKSEGLVLGNDGYSQGSIENPRQYVTTQEYSGGQAFYKGYRETVENAMNNIATEGLTIRGKGGSYLSIRNLAEMRVRFEVQREEIAELKNQGHEYVVASTHINSSARCEIWQGKVFILDADPTSEFRQDVDLDYKPIPVGKIDGVDYYSLVDAMQHGFLGYNCRHRLVKYTRGMNFFRKYNPLDIKRERNAEQRQRQMERYIIALKQKKEMAIDKVEEQTIKNNIYNYEKMYYNYCKE